MATIPINPMLTLVAAECTHCGSTADSVRQDRYLLGEHDAACCTSPAGERVCWHDRTPTHDPFWLAGRAFCCRACAADGAE